MSAEMLPAALLNRKALVYVRQSTQTQVQTNLESQRRKYDLVEVARRHGFVNIEVIDDDLGVLRVALWTVSAGINRHIVGDERALRKRRSDFIPASSLACGSARSHSEA